jgi:hypothetical protein
MTPAEWNSGGSWGRPTEEMKADMTRFIQFVETIPLAKLNPERMQLTFNDPEVRGWGVAGPDGGLFWVQDFALESQPIADIARQMKPCEAGCRLKSLARWMARTPSRPTIPGRDFSLRPSRSLAR